MNMKWIKPAPRVGDRIVPRREQSGRSVNSVGDFNLSFFENGVTCQELPVRPDADDDITEGRVKSFESIVELKKSLKEPW